MKKKLTTLITLVAFAFSPILHAERCGLLDCPETSDCPAAGAAGGCKQACSWQKMALFTVVVAATVISLVVLHGSSGKHPSKSK